MLLTHFDKIFSDLNLLVKLLSFVGDKANWPCYCFKSFFIFSSFHIFRFISKFNPLISSLNDLGSAGIESLNSFDLCSYNISIFICNFDIFHYLFSR